MKKILCLLFALTIFFVLKAQENLLVNGDFETGDKSGWGGGFSVQADSVYNGNYTAQLGHNKGLNQGAEIESGKTYKVSCVAKNSKLKGVSIMSSQFKDGQWKHSNYIKISDTVWTNYSFTVMLRPRDTSDFRIGFYNETKKNTTWIDNVSLTELDTSGLGHEKEVMSTGFGILDKENKRIYDIEIGAIGVGEFLTSLELSENAEAKIFDKASHKSSTGAKSISKGMLLAVVAEDGSMQEYDLVFADHWLKSAKTGTLDNKNQTIQDVDPSLLVIEFKYKLRTFDGIGFSVLDSIDGGAVTKTDKTYLNDKMVVRVDGSLDTSYYSITLAPHTYELGNEILSTGFGNLDSENLKIINLPVGALKFQLSSVISVSPKASFSVVKASGDTVSSYEQLNESMKVKVVAENGDVREYGLSIGNEANKELVLEELVDGERHEHYFQEKVILLKGKSSLNLYEDEAKKVLKESTVILNSEDAWLYLYYIKPSVVNDSLLRNILINDKPAVLNQNVRLVQFKDGCVVIPHGTDYRALKVFKQAGQKGASRTFGLYHYYRAEDLGGFDNNVASFVLKKGYMATFAEEPTGRGISRVKIANDKDLVLDVPEVLNGKVSFVRVIPWRWPHKKGWCGGGTNQPSKLECAWRYDWNNKATSNLDMEYVPMRHNKKWNQYENINYKENSTHVLGFNEPDRPDQANMGVDKALELWPYLLESGLRLGSPAPSDGGLNWLYKFMDKAKKKGYRVDFVAIHYYRGCGSANSFYNFCKAVNKRTGKPVWITEWNNGANWTKCEPTYEEQQRKIRSFVDKLDKTPFVERYAIYNWVGKTRAMFGNGGLTLAGEEYRDNIAPMAYNPDKINYYKNYVEEPSDPEPHNSVAEYAMDVSDGGAKVWIYPNPVQDDMVNVMGLESEQLVEVFTVQGKKVLSVRTYSDLNIGGLEKGFYFLTVDGAETVKFVKE